MKGGGSSSSSSSTLKRGSRFSRICKQALMVLRLVSCRNGAGSREGVLWKKQILKGERCRPLVFSGNILFDSEGNRLPDCSPPRR
ncbi:hypothetical protein KSP39_PZI017170 [Platanthera zijinensis]|uniref:Uncharacterized protein n=1 Tax=Platanthera zijinensis TaxID=2320716 RepID=A0AAP0B5K8_9ASPA